jgi:hypothetical protein
MPRQARKIVEKTYYYDSESESESDSDFDPDDYKNAESRCPVMQVSRLLAVDSESESESDSDRISDSEDGTDYETETEPDSDSEQLDEPKPYFGKGFRVYFDSHADKKFFMQAFGFN